MFQGFYQQDVLTAIKNLSSDGDIVYDVGAHHGLMSIVASKSVGNSGKIIAFEPNPQALKYLYYHLELNNIMNVKVESVGLLDKEGYLDFYPQTGEVTWNSSFIREFVDPQRKIGSVKVKTTTLDNYVNDTGLIPNLIKIDTEGTELFVLKGGLETIKKYSPTIIMGFNPKSAKEANFSIEDVVRFFTEQCYYLFVLKTDMMGYYKFNMRENFDEHKHCYNDLTNVICLPRDNIHK